MSAAADLVHYKMNFDAYDHLVAMGVFQSEDRVELIDGELIRMAPIGQDHEASVNSLNYALVVAFGERAIVSVQNSVRLPPRSAPQPDFVVLRPRHDRYRTGTRPGAQDALLLIEVAHSSLAYDRRVKLPLYAEAGVPEVWIVNLQDRVLEVYRQPSGNTYGDVTSFRPDETVALLLAPDIAIALRPVFD